MRLFQPAWMSENALKTVKAINAVEKINDEATLYKVATTAPLKTVRSTAVQKIRDPRFLRELALSGELHHYDLLAVCERIEDQNVLIEVVRKSSEKKTALRVWRLITSPSTRLSLAIDPSTIIELEDLTPSEISLVSDETLLLQIGDAFLKNPSHFYNCDTLRTAYQLVEHRPLSWSIYLENRENEAAETLVKDVEALEYPQDRDGLALVAQSSCTERAAYRAIEKLARPEEVDTLRAIALDAERPRSIRRAAALALPEGDSTLDTPCCPKCGAYGTVYRFNHYSQMDDANTEGYRCKACNNSNIRYQFDCNLETWVIPLRTFLEIE